MQPKPYRQRRSERLLAEAEAAHAYLSSASEARNDFITMLNLEKACKSFRLIAAGVARGRLDPKLEGRIVAAQQGLRERLFNVACTLEEL